jgi:hypothetical protein
MNSWLPPLVLNKFIKWIGTNVTLASIVVRHGCLTKRHIWLLVFIELIVFISTVSELNGGLPALNLGEEGRAAVGIAIKPLKMIKQISLPFSTFFTIVFVFGVYECHY